MVFVSRDTPYIWQSAGGMMETKKPGRQRFIEELLRPETEHRGDGNAKDFGARRETA
jgi:hypothetical protein